MWFYWLQYFFWGSDAHNILEKSFCFKNNRFHSKVIRKRNAITLMVFSVLLTTASMSANAVIFTNTSTGAAITTTTTCSGRVLPLNKDIVVIATTGSNCYILSSPEIACQKTIQNVNKSAYKASVAVNDDTLLNSVLYQCYVKSLCKGNFNSFIKRRGKIYGYQHHAYAISKKCFCSKIFRYSYHVIGLL